MGAGTQPAQFALWALLGVALVTSVVTDIRSRRIPDWVTYPTWVACIGLRAWTDGLGGLDRGALSGLVGTVAGAGLFALMALVRSSFGWGDVKLMAAVGVGFGFPVVLSALVLISIAGVGQAMLTLGLRLGWVQAALSRVGTGGRLRPSKHLPYGVAIAAGSFWTMWWEVTHTV